jgi:hypothetical protein
VAIAMVGGLLIVFGRVAWGVARSQRRNDIHEQTAPPDTAGPDTAVPDTAVPDDGADVTTSP